MHKDTVKRNIFLMGVFIYFIACTTLFLEGLGLETNEAFEPLYALQMLHRNTQVNFPYTLMVSPYEGHFISYPLLYLFALFGPSVFISRCIFVFFSLISLISIFYVIKRWFKEEVALLTIFLLGINLNFIRAARVGGLRDEIIQIALVWSAIALVQLYIDRKQKIYLYASAFILGLALWAKIVFVDLFLASLVTFIAFGRKGPNFTKNNIPTTKKDLAVFFLMFMAGASPFIIFNLTCQENTLRHLWHAFSSPTIYGYNNLAYFRNLSLRVDDLFQFLSYRNAPEMLFGVTVNNYFHIFLFFVSLFGIMSYVLFSKRQHLSKNKLLFLISTCTIIFFLLPFVPQQPCVEHLFILFPFIQIIEATFIFLIPLFVKNTIMPMALIICMLLPHVSLEFYNARRFLGEIKNGGGTLYFSPIIKDIANYAERQGIKKLFAMSEYLLALNIDFLTDLKVEVRELYEVYPYDGMPLSADAVMDSIYKREMEPLRQIYVIVRRDGHLSDSAQEAFEVLTKIALEQGRERVLLKKFSGKGGAPLFELYVIK